MTEITIVKSIPDGWSTIKCTMSVPIIEWVIANNLEDKIIVGWYDNGPMELGYFWSRSYWIEVCDLHKSSMEENSKTTYKTDFAMPDSEMMLFKLKFL